MPRNVSLGFCSLSFALALLFANPAQAIERATPQSIRVTSGAFHHHSTGRSWGHFLAFASPVDLTGSGRTGSQAYIFSVEDYACQKGRPELIDPDLTGEPPLVCPSPPHPYIIRATDGLPVDQIDNPSVNSTGKIVAFEAFGSLTSDCASKPGAANHRQIFISDLTTHRITAVTCEPDGDSYTPSLNDAGGAVTFVSTARLTSQTTGIPQIYVYQYQSPDPTKVGKLTGVTYGPYALGVAPSAAPMLNKLGDHIVFESRSDLLGNGLDTGIWNIFWFDRAAGQLFQVTAGDGDSHNAYVEEKRPGSVFFDSVATNLNGSTPTPGIRQIYRADIQETGDLPLIEQWTFGDQGSFMPAVEPNGGKVVFLSNADLLSNGTSGTRLFAIDFRDPLIQVLYQITGRGNIQDRIGANIGSWFASFDTDDDVGGYGVCGREVWIVVYDPNHYTEAGHVRMASSTIGLAPGEPFPGSADLGCANGNDCDTDHCVNGAICQHGAKPDGTLCGDGDPCTGGMATCQLGKCIAEDKLNCDDNNLCTADTCDPTTGCANAPITCNDNNPCTDDSCDPATGCTFTLKPAMDGVSCQSDQIQDHTDNSTIAKAITRGQKLIKKAQHGKPRGVIKKLKQAQKLFGSALRAINDDGSIPASEARALMQKIADLLDQIGEVLNTLKGQASGGSK